MLEAAETVPPPRSEEPPVAASGGYAAAEVPTAPAAAPSTEFVEAPYQASSEPQMETQGSAAIDGESGEQKGFFGRQMQRLSENEKVQKLLENEKVQKATEWTKEKAKQVSESEKVQKATEWTKEKAKQVAESERVQKATEWTKEKATQIAENERVQAGVAYVSDKSKQIADKGKEAAQSLKAKAGGAWTVGKGSIRTIKEELGSGAWRGSAKDTLGMQEKMEQWKNIKVSGAEEITVPSRSEHTCVYIVTKGSTLRWTFRVKERDLGFAVRMRIQEFGGSREEEVLPTERYDDTETVSGSWVADEDRQIVLVFDNTYSKLRSKTIAYLVGTEKPPIAGAENFEVQESTAAEGSSPSS